MPLAWSSSQSVSAGVLTYSTYLRDGFTPSAVTTDAAGNVYIVGSLIVDASSGQLGPMVMKLNPAGTQFIYTRTLGGSLNDTGTAIAVDSAGDAYVTGMATSPDFPVTAGRSLATPPAGPALPAVSRDSRTFLVKLDPQGSVVFSELLGGPVRNVGQAVAVTAQGDTLVSGISAPGFPVTAGAYNASGTDQRPYLMRLDPTGATVKFSAFGIGGSALVTDSTGNIYMAGSTLLLDYPTTPGAYQPVFKLVTVCYGFCRIAFPATNQYLTKLDPTGTKLIYSTAVAGSSQTTNTGLAVDQAGNAYLSGITVGSYPYSAKPPDTPEVRPFLTKLDPGGQRNLFSVAIGGAGVALDEKGHVIVGGSYNNLNLSGGVPFPQVPLPGLPPGVTALPQQCQENDVTTTSQAYVSQVDSETGNALSTVLVDASNLTAIGVALAGSAVWLAGIADQADVPITPGALAPFLSRPAFSPARIWAKPISR